MLSREQGEPELVEVDGNAVYISSGTKVNTYKFDSIFGKTADQKTVFEATVPQIQCALEGLNTTIFTYGQTGTGKTHTMLGHDLWELAADDQSMGVDVQSLAENEEIKGLIPRAMNFVFSQLQEADHKLSVQYLEIYNEKIYDLIRPEHSAKTSLDLREDRVLGVIVPDAEEVDVYSEQEVLSVLWQGARNRAMNATEMNDTSSRSHTVFQVAMEVTGLDEDGAQLVRKSKISLVDLAGSEKWRNDQLTEMSEQRIKELTAINQSLSALANVVAALLQPNRSHVPYRNSKLTRLLQDSLGGNTRTTFIVTLSPSASSVEETISTLQFADRAKKVVVHARVNEELKDGDLIKKQEHEILKLKKELQHAQEQISNVHNQSGGERPAGLAIRPGGSAAGGVGSVVSAGGSGAGSSRLGTTMSLEELQRENLSLLQTCSDLRRQLFEEKEEKRRLLEAATEEDGGDAAAGESAYTGQEEGHAAGGKSPSKAMRVLAVQTEVLETKIRQVEETKLEQRQKSEWLDKYHTWLRGLPIHTDSKGKGDSLSLKKRVSLMEASVLMQSEDLKRAKQIFARDTLRLQEDLGEKSKTLEIVQKRLQEAMAGEKTMAGEKAMAGENRAVGCGRGLAISPARAELMSPLSPGSPSQIPFPSSAYTRLARPRTDKHSPRGDGGLDTRQWGSPPASPESETRRACEGGGEEVDYDDDQDEDYADLEQEDQPRMPPEEEEYEEEEALADENEWQEHVDPASNSTYYYNTRTQESVWSKPY
jgi:kinesin family protein 3/17